VSEAVVPEITGLSPKDQDRLITLLERLDPSQPLAPAVAAAITRVMPVVTFECILLRRHPANSSNIEVYLMGQSRHDIGTSDRLHSPRTTLQMSDVPVSGTNQFQSVVSRLARELGLSGFAYDHFMGIEYAGPSGPVHAVKFVWCCRPPANQEPQGGQWYDAVNLPSQVGRRSAARIIEAGRRLFQSHRS
jgi:hypothetical protein